MINALSIDLEYWWSAEFIANTHPERNNDLILESVIPLLKLLDKHQVYATFFVLGVVAENYPEIVEYIYDKGHEIASHSYSHKTLFELGKEGFEKEIIMSKRLLSKYNPIGFRAPSFSINSSTKWAFNILREYGFRYDSSIFPFKTFLYGVPNAPRHIYFPSEKDIIKNDPDGKIMEFPLSVYKCCNINVPIAGGFYFRALPLPLIKYAIRKLNETIPAIIYIHPWETYLDTPVIDMPPHLKFITYHGISKCLEKLELLIRALKFSSLREVLYEV